MAEYPKPPYPLHASIKDRLHPEYRAFYEKYLINAPQVHYQPVAASRTGGKIIPGGSDPLPVGKTEDVKLKRKETKGPDVTVRVFTPEGTPPAAGWPVMMYYHGGGWVLGTIDTENTVCTNMCVRAKCVVITTDYRLAPEDPYPAAVEDSWEAVLWTFSDAAKTALNIDLAKVAVGGSSAGGNLAAIVAHKGAPRGFTFVAQLLIVPVTDNTATVANSATYKEYQYTAALPAEKMLWYRRHYLPDEKDWPAPESSPLFYPDASFAKMAPAVVIVGGLDVLRGEGEQYAAKLQKNGVAARVQVMEGMPHPFLAMDAVMTAGKKAIDILCETLNTAFY